MGWDPSFFRARAEVIARGFPVEIEEEDPLLPPDPEFAARLVGHVRAFDEALVEAPLLSLASRPSRVPISLLRARWTAPNGGVIEIVVTTDGSVHLDNHAGLDAICAVYRHLCAIDERFVIFDPSDGSFHDETSLRRSLAARNAGATSGYLH
jgi:hypothetical protein